MKTWKSKIFGDNRSNFYGCLGTSSLLAGLSIWLFSKAIDAGALRSPSCLLFMAIYVIVLGHFSISTQNYLARVANTIELEDAKKKSAKSEAADA
ncbi:MAG: hypothetical protein JWR19_4548 [Pedosphaera sp.]|nr:hypothetical protein [Pedosphaera sp.]